MYKSIMKRCALLVAALFFSLPMVAQLDFEIDRSVKESRVGIIRNTLLTIDDDAKAIINRPLKNPNLSANGVKLFAMIVTDYQTTKFFQEHVEPLDVHIRSVLSFPDLYPNLPVLGRWAFGVDGWMYTGVTAMYAAGVLTGHEKMQEAGILTVKAVVESYVVSHVLLKTLVARHRPARPLGGVGSDRDSQYPFVQSPLDFFNFHVPYLHSDAYGTGFPSYHATMFFAFASVNSKVFDNSWVPYALAGTALLYDIRGHNHWVSELVAGAVIGEFIGKVVYENYHERRNDSNSLKKKRKYSTQLGMGQNFGVVGPSVVLSW
ncbi:MAG: phosphatase PAP2 family protein [Cryomorphaceae bacterium]|nr:phosphatase PAP2 family protein [Cryomorphaceae bacterium]MBL6867608.1 phosphatase PAP2 family protein [Cryomorphaceae bacterium]